ncbi:Nn.00g014120.m01.CDS01 [Neocucurbitaria sp. VM-36]
MPESETSPSSDMPRSSTDRPAFRIVLQDVNQYDTYGSREFDLPLNSTFPIGRASKNATKKELMPAPHNAYIDSPVISREHALLSANTSSGTPQVYISDKGSMHGTMVNGQALTPNTPKQLSAGDVLQFGIDVNRNEEYFVARKYKFESRLSRPFSLGFAVPDADSEEEEVEPHGRRGSQLNPFTIDDSEPVSEQSGDDQRDVTMVHEVVVQDEDPTVVTETRSVYEEYPDSAVRISLVEDSYSEDDEVSMVYSSQSEDEELREAEFDSDAASVGSSEPEYNSSEREVPDSEEEEPIEEGPYKQSSMTNPQTVQPRDLLSIEMASNQAPELPSLGIFSSQHFDSNNPFSSSIVPPMPPRPLASKAAPWNNTEFTSFGQQPDGQSWYSDEMPGPQSYLGTNFGDRPSIFSPAPPPPGPESIKTHINGLMWSGAMYSAQPADRMQTPPPMPTSDVTTSPPLQPNRRTKVSIEEIVEEQPLTPASVNSMKRKADVLEEEETLIVTEPVVSSEELVDSAAQTAAIIAQRPKKQPRSILGKALSTAAYPLLGAAGAVVSFTLLSTLPDAFFGA